MQGYLNVSKGSVLGGSKKKWFKLEGPVLSVCDNRGDESHQHVDVRTVGFSDGGKKDFCVDFPAGGGHKPVTWKLKCSSEGEKAMWLGKLKVAKTISTAIQSSSDRKAAMPTTEPVKTDVAAAISTRPAPTATLPSQVSGRRLTTVETDQLHVATRENNVSNYSIRQQQPLAQKQPDIGWETSSFPASKASDRPQPQNETASAGGTAAVPNALQARLAGITNQLKRYDQLLQKAQDREKELEAALKEEKQRRSHQEQLFITQQDDLTQQQEQWQAQLLRKEAESKEQANVFQERLQQLQEQVKQLQQQQQQQQQQ
eukprot:CAMPEP_0175140362 /NCGR_PEP_ID=MMETSP0087-20121206/11434_1 /TAXON_ID=136419 /ORGANISM="Unknown Unknown, Strain D1" /LENGTH=314 /DNA_ID=CAMNT_0016423511 /DNA_START=127 /DNA_END=1068 /DNA_ORIENTATION=-